jgi:hypothetical protein
LAVFETAAIDRSATHPLVGRPPQGWPTSLETLFYRIPGPIAVDQCHYGNLFAGPRFVSRGRPEIINQIAGPFRPKENDGGKRNEGERTRQNNSHFKAKHINSPMF